MTRYRLYFVSALGQQYESIHTEGPWGDQTWEQMLRVIRTLPKASRTAGRYVVREAGESS